MFCFEMSFFVLTCRECLPSSVLVGRYTALQRPGCCLFFSHGVCHRHHHAVFPHQRLFLQSQPGCCLWRANLLQPLFALRTVCRLAGPPHFHTQTPCCELHFRLFFLCLLKSASCVSSSIHITLTQVLMLLQMCNFFKTQGC